MNASWSILLPIALLGLSIVLVWSNTRTKGDRIALAASATFSTPLSAPAIAPAATLFSVLALLCGLVSGLLTWLACGALIAYALLAAWTRAVHALPARLILEVLVGLFALALAIHWIPGFPRHALISAVAVSEGAAAVTQFANFDKGAAGLVLVLFLVRRCQSLQSLGLVAVKTLPIAAVTLAAVFVCGLGLQYVAFDPKLPAITLPFLLVNLLLTVVAEEAFFRGLLQARLTRCWGASALGRGIAIACSASLFALAHAGGGAAYVALSGITGLGAAWAWQRQRLIEAPVMVHFLVNVVHFLFFTYPALL